MALIICPECGKQVSDQAKLCPDCGYPLQKSIKSNKTAEKRANFKHKLKSRPAKLLYFCIVVIAIIAAAFTIVPKMICLDHEYTWKVTTKATCINEGEKTEICNKCGKKGDSVSIPKAEHSFQRTTLKNATCAEDGTAEQTCSICGFTETVVIPHKGHTYVEATCTQAKHCKNCGQVAGEPLGHDYYNGSCTRCNEEQIFGPNEEFLIKDEFGNGLLGVTFHSAKVHYACNYLEANEGAEYVIVTYSYRNINYSYQSIPSIPPLGVFISQINLKAYDETGEFAQPYPCIDTVCAYDIPKNSSCSNVSMAFELKSTSSKIKIIYDDGILMYIGGKVAKGVFEIPIQ